VTISHGDDDRKNFRTVDVAPPPQTSKLTESAILGAIVVDNDSLPIAAALIEPSDFFFLDHRTIFVGMLEMAEKEIPIGSRTLFEHLHRANRLDAAGGIEVISKLGDGIPQKTDVTKYCKNLKRLSSLRSAAHAALALEHALLDPRVTAEELQEHVQSISANLAPEEKLEDVLKIDDMPQTALDGRLGSICERRLAGFPRAYAWIALLTVAGTVVPRSEDTRANLYAALVGPVGSGKSKAIKYAGQVMGITPPQLSKVLAGSAEGLIEKLSEAAGDSRLLSPDELSHLLNKAQIDRASFPEVLNTAYYEDTFDLTMARGKKAQCHVRLGIIGGVRDENDGVNFGALFGSATMGGLYDRFIFGRNPHPYQYLYRPFEGTTEPTEPCTVRIAHEVWEARDEWLSTIPELSGRCAEHAIRVAVIAAAFDGRTILYAKHLGPARAFVEYQTRIRAVFKPNPGENQDAKCAFAILSALGQDGGWRDKRTIYRKIHGSRFGPGIFERAILALKTADDIDITRSRPLRIRRRR
jgi:hypothetical protein